MYSIFTWGGSKRLSPNIESMESDLGNLTSANWHSEVTWPNRDLTRLFLKSVSIPDSFRLDPFELVVEAVEAGCSRAAAKESLLSSVSEDEDVASGTGDPVVVEGVDASEKYDMFWLKKLKSEDTTSIKVYHL